MHFKFYSNKKPVICLTGFVWSFFRLGYTKSLTTILLKLNLPKLQIKMTCCIYPLILVQNGIDSF